MSLTRHHDLSRYLSFEGTLTRSFFRLFFFVHRVQLRLHAVKLAFQRFLETIQEGLDHALSGLDGAEGCKDAALYDGNRPCV